GSLGILFFTLLGFVVYLKALDPEPTISLDTDWFYRRAARLCMWFAEKPVVAWEGALSGISDSVILRFLHASARGGLLTDLNVVDAIV
ncbi:Na+/H+ antiporter subunit D, partial [Shewanella sp. C32]|nr:Na+/H+ antiporter subunit D [Shewanella electrica]